jgi:beta-lactam-binding protein with PASTA domain
MNGAFSVGSAQLPPPPPPPSAQARCKVPKVVGKRLTAARRAITRARCRVGRIRRARSRKARGRVVKQTPRAGVRRPRGTRVHLVVSRGRR